MSYEKPTDWDAIFNGSTREFTPEEMSDSGMSDLAPLAKICPKFWEQYKNLGKNSKRFEEIWDLEYEWAEAVHKQRFWKARQLYHRLKKVKV